MKKKPMKMKKMKKISFRMLAVACLFGATAVTGHAGPLAIGGFVRSDVIFDSRQSQSAAEGLYTYYPLPENRGADGRDVNSASSVNILALTTRLTATYTGQINDNLQARGYVEADFGSNLSGNGAVFRMRHAYMELKWAHDVLTLGQTWHPLSAAVIPVTLDLNTGSPFRPFSRSPQIRYDRLAGDWTFTVAVVSQHSYASTGPAGVSSTYMRNASLPDLTAGFKWKMTEHLAWGLMGEYKELAPKQSTTAGGNTYKTDAHVRSHTGQGWMEYADDRLKVRGAAIYAQNMFDAQMMGGYAVRSTDSETGHETYTPTEHACYWVNLQYGTAWQYGFFAGYIKQLGTCKVVDDASVFYGRACNMTEMFRVAPRVSRRVGNFELAAEVEWNKAGFGSLKSGTAGDVSGVRYVNEVKVDVAATLVF